MKIRFCLSASLAKRLLQNIITNGTALKGREGSGGRSKDGKLLKKLCNNAPVLMKTFGQIQSTRRRRGTKAKKSEQANSINLAFHLLIF